MVFTTLLFREGLSRKERARANGLVGTSHRVNAAEQASMVKRAGWKLVVQSDVTAEYAETMRRNLRAYEARSVLARKVMGKTEFENRMERERRYLQGIEDGLLRRELFAAQTGTKAT
jgi:hypothetical protein